MRFCLLLLIGLLFPSPHCQAAERTVISVIFSSDLQPYKDAWKGFSGILDQKGMSPKTFLFDLSKDGPQKILENIANQKPDLIYALGTGALKCAGEKITHLPVIYA